MSYRELRNVAEMLRALGYPRLVSVENFRNPNFPLVAEVLAWIVKRFDPKADDFPSDVDTEHDRVMFIRMVAQFMASKAHVRLNTKKLYQADGFAVQEILKALTLLYSALQNNADDPDLDDEGSTTHNFDMTNRVRHNFDMTNRVRHNFDMTNRTGELKQIRSLASNITTRGATLFDLLRREVNLRASKAHVRLNTKKLYQADGFAVQEILKALTLLYSALQNNADDPDLDDEGSTTHNFDMTNRVRHNFDMTNRTGELKQIRSLASNITTRGATLFDLLRREVNLREMRTNVMNRPLEVIDVERGLQEAIGACEAELRETQKAIENVATDEATVEAKCEKKKMALERNQKRLQSIKKSRPAFMDEYEKLEAQLKLHYNTFVQRFMSLSFLEQRLEDNERTDHNQMSQREAVNKRVLDMKNPGSLDMFGDDSDEDSGGDGDDDDDDDDVDDEYERPMNSFKSNKSEEKKTKGGRVFGSMTGDVDLDSLSDTDLNLHESPEAARPPLMGGESEDLEDDFGGGVEALLEEEGGMRGGGGSRGMRRPAAAAISQIDDEDNDF
ncbi:Clusterin-associated protein-1 [Trinorchestia longiramus]|nr:Clusterin-associated protein-1 [Trinorchestia longiramus]